MKGTDGSTGVTVDLVNPTLLHLCLPTIKVNHSLSVSTDDGGDSDSWEDGFDCGGYDVQASGACEFAGQVYQNPFSVNPDII